MKTSSNFHEIFNSQVNDKLDRFKAQMKFLRQVVERTELVFITNNRNYSQGAMKHSFKKFVMTLLTQKYFLDLTGCSKCRKTST